MPHQDICSPPAGKAGSLTADEVQEVFTPGFFTFFEGLVRFCESLLRCFPFIKSPREVAEDIVQDAMVRLVLRDSDQDDLAAAVREADPEMKRRILGRWLARVIRFMVFDNARYFRVRADHLARVKQAFEDRKLFFQDDFSSNSDHDPVA